MPQGSVLGPLCWLLVCEVIIEQTKRAMTDEVVANPFVPRPPEPRDDDTELKRAQRKRALQMRHPLVGPSWTKRQPDAEAHDSDPMRDAFCTATFYADDSGISASGPSIPRVALFIQRIA